MSQDRYFSSATRPTSLAADPGSSGTTLTVADSTVFASLDGMFPWTLLIDWGGAGQEIVDVTGRPSSTTLTVTRGRDGTAGQAHAAGVVVQHGVSGRDLNALYAHMAQTSGMHGISGSIVDTTSAQTLSNKTLTAPTIGSFLNAAHDHSSAATGGTVASAALLPTVSVYQTTGVFMNAGGASPTMFVMPWQAEQWEDNVTANAMHDVSTNNSRLTAPNTAKYLIQCTVKAGANTTYGPGVYMNMRLNGTTTIRSATGMGAPSQPTSVTISTVVKLTAGNYVEFLVGHTISVSPWTTTVTGADNTYATMTQLSA